MNADDPNLDILQNLEFSVIQLFKQNPTMTDYVALRAYEALFQHYRAEFRGGIPKASNLTGLDALTFEAARAVCEWRLGRGPAPAGLTDQPAPASVETVMDCLRKLVRSVEFNTKQDGRQGYLNFVKKFMP